MIIAKSLERFPFTEDRKRETAIISLNGEAIVVTKGSPETVFKLSILTPEEFEKWNQLAIKWAQGGHKVLACAQKKISSLDIKMTKEPSDKFTFLGLLAFEDPARPEVAAAIEYTQKKQIKVLMLTGDHPETARAIARDIGLGGDFPNIISAENDESKFEDSYLNTHLDFLKSLDVVARCKPSQKLRIVKALQRSGELVAVTGDGINDVPALRVADIGIAMGMRGTRSAKEVSSIVLGDDNFGTIVSAIKEGRQLFFNLKTSFKYLLLIHIPFVLTAAFIPLFGYPLVYLPVHIVWLELILHPTAILAFQSLAHDEVKSSPRVIFSKQETSMILIIGLLLSVVIGIVFINSLDSLIDVSYARAKVLVMLSLWSLALVLCLSKENYQSQLHQKYSGKNDILLLPLYKRIFFRYKNNNAIFIAGLTLFQAVLLIQDNILNKYLHISGISFQDWILSISVIGFFSLIILRSKNI